MELKSLIRDIPDFPQAGILFRDITTLLKNPEGLQYTINNLHQQCEQLGFLPDYILGIESRGFIFAPTLAYKFGAGFVPVRKAGKLPAAVHSIKYDLEYGTDTLEVHQDGLEPGAKVLIVDDLIATGGTAKATADLVKTIGCDLLGFAFIIELDALKGRKQLPDVPIVTLMNY